VFIAAVAIASFSVHLALTLNTTWVRLRTWLPISKVCPCLLQCQSAGPKGNRLN